MSFMDKLFEFFTFIAGVVGICAVVSLPFACTAHEDRLIAEAIKNGIDPMTAKCSIGTSSYDCRYLRRSGL
jgi:hypothetical protein